jgi:hypothetical protein
MVKMYLDCATMKADHGAGTAKSSGGSGRGGTNKLSTSKKTSFHEAASRAYF